MSGLIHLDTLLSQLQPELAEDEFVFCFAGGKLRDYVDWEPLAAINETEGLTLVLTKATAENAGLQFDGVFARITLKVHSSLHAVGLTAAVSSKLAEVGISCNVIAGYYHDHIFVQGEKATAALSAIRELTN